MNFLGRAVQAINSISLFFSRLAEWLCLFLVLLTAEQVLARYLFGKSSVALQELEWHLFGFVFLFAAANALREDAHVRVDLLYTHGSPRTKALIDIFGIITLLLPVCGVLIIYGIGFAHQSLAFENPRPPDYYTASIASANSVLHSALSAVEGLVRKTILVGEISPDPGGLEGRWIIKAAVPLGFLLVAMQSLALLVEKIQLLFSPPKD